MRKEYKNKNQRKLSKAPNLKERRRKCQKMIIVKMMNQNKYLNNKNLLMIVIMMMMLKMIKRSLIYKYNKKQFRKKYLMEKLIKMK